jgi:hypothetical protein
MNSTQTIILEVAAIGILLAIGICALLLLRTFMRRLQNGQGPMGSVIQQSREVAKENVAVARERIQLEKELLATQKETNELLKQILAKKKNDAS